MKIFYFTFLNFDGVPGEVAHIDAAILHILAYYITENLFEMCHYILPMHGHIFVVHNHSCKGRNNE